MIDMSDAVRYLFYLISGLGQLEYIYTQGKNNTISHTWHTCIYTWDIANIYPHFYQNQPDYMVEYNNNSI